MSFLLPVDIANRACQHIGASRIDVTQGFSEVSTQAGEIGFCYDKLRQAELRRNVWRFAIKRAVLRPVDVTTRLLAPSLWAQTTTYFVGSIVADSNGTLWISQIPNNLNNEPISSSSWAEYFGPLTVMAYDSTTAYFAGELVYTAAGNGTYRVYISLVSGNADNPATATAYDATASYLKNQVVTYLSVAYMSLIDLNTNNTPNLAPALFNIATTYSIGQQVGSSDGVIYTSLANGNVGHDPTISPASWTNTGVLNPWTTVFVGGSGSLKWLEIGGAEFPFGVGLVTLNIVYPIGAGPSSQSTTRNVFRLPAGFLRKAPRDPKAGSTSYLGASWGLDYDDWLFEGNYIVSSQVDALMFRFVADTVDVAAMDPMFCEGLAARIAVEVCERITQSAEKLQTIASHYKLSMGEARTVNGIETGPEEPPVDNYISCRA